MDIINYQSFVYGSFVQEIHVRYTTFYMWHNGALLYVYVDDNKTFGQRSR